MKLQTVFFSFVASVALCQNVPTGGSDLLAVLQSDPDTQGFGQLLGEFPDLITNLDPAKKYTVFAPSNAAVVAFRQSFNINGSLVSRSNHLNRRSLSEYAAAIALLFTDQSNQANLNTEATNLITNLTDPAFINISPASVSASLTQSSTPTPLSSSSVQSSSSSVQSSSSSVLSTTSSAPSASSPAPTPSTLAQPPSSLASPPGGTLLPTPIPPPPTSSPAPPASTPPSANCPALRPKPKNKRSIPPYSSHFRRQLNGSTLLVSSGFGNIAEASLSEAPYNNGSVRKVDSFFTLFGDLASTLQQTNGTAFANALIQAGTLDSLSKTPRITVFVPDDSVLQGQTLDANALKRYVLPDTLATTPSLSAGSYKTSAGDSVNVTSNADGSFSINNATIVKSDVMIKNGVIHYIDNVYTGTLAASAPGLNIPTLAIVVALLVSSASIF